MINYLEKLFFNDNVQEFGWPQRNRLPFLMIHSMVKELGCLQFFLLLLHPKMLNTRILNFDKDFTRVKPPPVKS